jgi:hypothetical protein
MIKTTPIWIVIPTYWGSTSEALYDHPTPLHAKSTLNRLLRSLENQKGAPPLNILILLATVSPGDEKPAVARVTEIISPYLDHFTIHLVTPRITDWLAKELEGEIPRLLQNALTMKGYGAVRTCQLLIPALYGAEIIIALDDDETVPEDYCARAVSYIGTDHGSKQILGISGPYVDGTGNPYLDEPEKTLNNFGEKAVLINETTRMLLNSPDPINITPMVFGGNMVFHHELFHRVSFDPVIPRGEDIDYLINARIAGFPFFFDRDLSITHLPPREFESSSYGKMKQDVIRFMYEREKILHGNLTFEEFMPYPGALLREDFTSLAREALALIGSSQDFAENGKPDEIIEDARRFTHVHLPRYFEFTEQWPNINPLIQKQTALLKSLYREMAIA